MTQLLSRKATRLAVLLTPFVLAGLGASVASADQWAIVGSRYQGMGGTGVAFSSDSLASYYNTANLGFEKGWDAQVPFTVNTAIENGALSRVDSFIDAWDDDSGSPGTTIADALRGSTPLNTAQTEDAVGLMLQFGVLGASGEALHFSADLGLAGHAGNFGVSVLSFSTGSTHPVIDRTNVGVMDTSYTGAQAVAALTTALTPGAPSNAALAAQIAALPGWNDPMNAGAAANFVYTAELEAANRGISVSDPTVSATLLGFAQTTGNPQAATNFQNNESGVMIAAFSIQEAAISYGHRVPIPYYKQIPRPARSILSWVHNKVSVGANLKFLTGITSLDYLNAQTINDAGEVVSTITGFHNQMTSYDWGLDLSLAYRPFEWLRFGMVARNVNTPTFAFKRPLGLPANGVGDFDLEVELEPQVRMGAAFTPFKSWLIAFDFDATENSLSTLPGFKSRIVSLGTEYTVPLLSRNIALALRLGAFNNVANSGADWSLTGGLGLRLWSFHLDLSGGGSLANEDIQTSSSAFSSVPSRVNAGMTLKWEKSI